MWTEQRAGTGLELSYAKRSRSRSSGGPSVSRPSLLLHCLSNTHSWFGLGFFLPTSPREAGRRGTGDGEWSHLLGGSCKGRRGRAQVRTQGARPGPPLRPSPIPSLPCASLSTCGHGLGWTAASTSPRLPFSWSDRPGRVPGARTVSDLPGWSTIPTYTARKEMKQSCKSGSTAEGAWPSPCCPSPPRREGPRWREARSRHSSGRGG